MIQDLSPIQNHILSKLKNAKSRRYAELMPDKVPNDLFNYHLQQLVKKEMILKTEDGYCLAEKGIEHVADPYTKNDAITSLFKINVITIVSRIHEGRLQILNQLRKSNPSYGKIGVMGGVVLKGELIEDAATRKLRQETGLEARLRLVGCERRIMYKSGKIFSDLMFPITYADEYSGNLIEETDFGKNLWVDMDDAIQNENASDYDYIEGVRKVLHAVKGGSIATMPFLFTEEVRSDDVNFGA